MIQATVYQIGDELILASERGMELTFKDVEFDERDWKFKKGGDF